VILKVARFVGLLLGALNLGLAWAHLVEMGPKRAMSGPEWLTTQQAYRDFGKVAGITVPAALLATLTQFALTRDRPADRARRGLHGGHRGDLGVVQRAGQPRAGGVAGGRPARRLGAATRSVGIRPRRECHSPWRQRGRAARCRAARCAGRRTIGQPISQDTNRDNAYGEQKVMARTTSIEMVTRPVNE
jgi:hypothetical protein